MDDKNGFVLSFIDDKLYADVCSCRFYKLADVVFLEPRQCKFLRLFLCYLGKYSLLWLNN